MLSHANLTWLGKTPNQHFVIHRCDLVGLLSHVNLIRTQGGPHKYSVLSQRLLWINNLLLLNNTESERDFLTK